MFTRVSLFVLIAALLGVTCEAFSKEETEIANASVEKAKLQPPQFITHKVFMDIEVDGEDWGRLTFGIFGKLAPKAAANFAGLADGTAGIGNHGKPLHYKGNAFHRVIPGMLAQAGDIINGNGTGGESIYG